MHSPPPGEARPFHWFVTLYPWAGPSPFSSLPPLTVGYLHLRPYVSHFGDSAVDVALSLVSLDLKIARS